MKSFTFLAALAALAPAAVFAADEAALTPPPSDSRWARVNSNPANKFGLTVEAGGGVGGFIDTRISNVTTEQGQWTVRAAVGTRSHFAAEAAYVGSAQGLNTAGVSSGATLTGNGLEGAFRLNLFTGAWQPYAIAGIGYTHYALGNATISTSDVQSTGDVATFPLGAGLAWRSARGMVLDGRMSFHPATTSALLRDSNMSTWDLQAKAGFEF